MLRYILTVLSCIAVFVSNAQIFTSPQNIGGVINEYASVSNINLNTNSFTVSNSSIFSECNKVLIIQMKGAAINETESSSFGDINTIGNAGNYEINTVKSIGGNVITFADLINDYDVSGKVQLIPIPEYQQGATVTSTLTCSPWDGSTGGVLIFEGTTLTMDGAIDVTGMGFRAGANNSDNIDKCSITEFTDSRNTMLYRSPSTNKTGAEKGEGIAESSFMFSIGKLGSGGGGGGLHNGSGGGGSNYGQGGSGALGSVNCPSSNPQGAKGQGASSLAPYINSGKLFLGGGGGAGQGNNGGSSSSSPNANNDLNYGGAGGGIIIIKVDEIRTTWTGNNYPRNGATISIIANGESAPNKVEAPQNTVYYDGAGGGGAGGSVLIDVGTINTTMANKLLEIEAVGGRGGDTQSNQDCYAPGGGGGGGVVYFSSAATPNGISGVSVLGGIKGGMLGGQESTTSCQVNRENTNGSNGIINYNLDLGESACCPTLGELTIDQSSLSICENNSTDNLTTTFAALTSGTNLSDYTITWYKDGTLINGESGATLSNSVVKANGSGDYSVSIELNSSLGCTYESPVVEVSLLSVPTATIANGQSVCDGDITSLPISLEGVSPWGVTYNDFENTQKTITGITTSPYSLSVTELGNYTLTAVSDNNCSATASGTGTFEFLEEVDYTIDTQCKDDNSALADDQFQIIIKITDGDLNTIQVNETTSFGVSFSRIGSTDEWISNAVDEDDIININVTDVNDCGGGKTFDGIQRVCSCPTSGNINLTGNSSICEGETSTVEVSFQNGIGPFKVVLYGSESGEVLFNSNASSPISFMISKEEKYTAVIENSGDNCTVNALGEVELKFEAEPTAILSGNETICNDGLQTGSLDVKLEGNSPWSIEYSNGMVINTIVSSTPDYILRTNEVATYSLVSVTDATTCAGTVSGSGVISSVSPPIALINEGDTVLCPNDIKSLTINKEAGVDYTWNVNGSFLSRGESVQITTTSKIGDFEVIADNGICPVTTSSPVTIQRTEIDLELLEVPEFILLDGEFKFEVLTNAEKVTWIDRLEGLSDIGNEWVYKPLIGGYRMISVEANKGNCTVELDFEMLVSQPLFIPNAFSPNGDGINDYWEIVGLEKFKNAQISIFNRWGAKIHQQIGPGDGLIWDGGNYPVGTYYYIVALGDEHSSSAQGAITITK